MGAPRKDKAIFMSRQEPLFSKHNGCQDNKPSIEALTLEVYQRLKEYRHALDQLNEHSAQMSEILRALEDEEQRNTSE